MFTLRLDGEVLAEVEEQVTGLRVITPRGEVGATGISPYDSVVDIFLDKVAPGSPPRLDQLEMLQAKEMRDRAEEGQLVGNAPPDGQKLAQGSLNTQGLHVETHRKGGVDRDETQSTVHNHPLRDLAEGLDPGDHETRTARIEHFGKHGDYDKAIKDNQPGSAQQRREESEQKQADTKSGDTGKQTAGAGAGSGGKGGSSLKV